MRLEARTHSLNVQVAQILEIEDTVGVTHRDTTDLIVGPTDLQRVVHDLTIGINRGAGETWACGTGACAATVVGALTGRTQRELTVHLLGGDLAIEWRGDNHVYMTGGAEEVFQGVVRV